MEDIFAVMSFRFDNSMCRGACLCLCLALLFFLLDFTQLSSAAEVTTRSQTNLEKADRTTDNAELAAPPEVLVEKITFNSVLLSWKPPRPSSKKLKLFTYSLTLTPHTKNGHGLEKELSLPPTTTSKQVEGLTEGTRYVVQLSAIYGDTSKPLSHENLVRVAAPKFIIHLPVELQQDIPVGDDGIPTGEPACNCSESGMVACTRKPGFVECACRPGYTGEWCEECAPGNFRAGKDCLLCPCSNLTSTAECEIKGNGQVTCKCLPGHRGSLCTSCTAGYKWTEDRCIPLDCLSSSLCAENRNSPGCEDCVFFDNKIPITAQRSNSDRAIADGTLPLIAVVITLGVLLSVAGLATCYRYWDHRRHQARIPFWSIELQDEKTDPLRAHCQYQHLDAATNRAIDPAKEAGRLNDDPRKIYNTMDL